MSILWKQDYFLLSISHVPCFSPKILAFTYILRKPHKLSTTLRASLPNPTNIQIWTTVPYRGYINQYKPVIPHSGRTDLFVCATSWRISYVNHGFFNVNGFDGERGWFWSLRPPLPALLSSLSLITLHSFPLLPSCFSTSLAHSWPSSTTHIPSIKKPFYLARTTTAGTVWEIEGIGQTSIQDTHISPNHSLAKPANTNPFSQPSLKFQSKI